MRVRESTYRGYEQAVRLHITPQLGQAKLAKLNASNVDAWLSDLDAKPRAKQNAFVTLKVALNYAVRELGLIDRNPVANMKAPRAPKREQRILTLPELQRLLKAAEGSPLYPLLYLAIVTSMRVGELFGLAWRDVDLDRGYLRVTQALAKAEGHTYAIAEPKTQASKRRIDLPKEAVAVLKAHRKKQNGAANPLGLVFPSETGSPLDYNNFQKRVFKPWLHAAKLKGIVFHSLRHSGNSILASEGHSLKLLQDRLGHSTPAVTFQVYTHLGATEGRAGADRLGKLLTGTNRGTNVRNGARKRSRPNKRKSLILSGFFKWLRMLDSNQRPAD